MLSCTCNHCKDIEDLFNEKTARKELRRYEKKGPNKTTKLLLDAIRTYGTKDKTLLDIGGGIGAIQHELFRDGLLRATQVDASSAYINISQEEAKRLGNGERVEYMHGDFIEYAQQISSSDIVTLDRVICCYPKMETLIEESLKKTRVIYGIVYPRERWGTRIVTAIGNLYFRIRGSSFRTYIHSSRAIDKIIYKHGFRRDFYRSTFLWHVVIYINKIVNNTT